MIDLQVYAAGLRERDHILRLGHALETCVGTRYKADPEHDMVYLEFDEPTVSLNQIRGIFKSIGLEIRFVGTIPDELRPPGKKTEKLMF